MKKFKLSLRLTPFALCLFITFATIMLVLYNIGIRVYLLLIRVASLFNGKARLWIRGRKGWKKELEGRFSKDDKLIWIHCASLGEFEQGRPLIEKIKERDASAKILLTFFSPSGYEVRKDYSLADLVMYLPADTPGNARLFIEMAAPDIAIFVKYEFWYNYLSELQERSLPHYLVSGIFREEHLFFRPYGRSFLKILRGFTYFFVQAGESERILRDHGISNVIVSGDTRFDRVYDIAAKAPGLEVLDSFCIGRDVLIAGSSWPAEEEMICSYINNNKGKAKWVIAPHETGDEHIEAIESSLEVSSLRYSSAGKSKPADYEVLIIDNIGLLSSIYSYGTLAVVGGGFGKGIHNILEPAAWGLPVLFGPGHKKFREAKELLSTGGAFTFGSSDQFSNLLDDLLGDRDKLRKAADSSREYVKSNLGATAIVLNKIL